MALPFRDRRLKEMLFRYRARNFKDSLNPEELLKWETFRAARLSDEQARARFENDMLLAMEQADEKARQVLVELKGYVASLL